eukprot:125232-Pyramimonas_sp.AAC.3
MTRHCCANVLVCDALNLFNNYTAAVTYKLLTYVQRMLTKMGCCMALLRDNNSATLLALLLYNSATLY